MSAYAGIAVDVRGIDEVQRMLDAASGPAVKRTLQKASTAGAKALKPHVKAAAPKVTGKLRRSVSSRQAAKERPAAVVSARPRVAFYRHMVIRGTKAHGPRRAQMLIFKRTDGPGNVYTKHVRGTPARPFVSEGYDRGRADADRAIDRVVGDYLDSL